VSSLAALVAGFGVGRDALPSANIGGDRVATRNRDGDDADWSSREYSDLQARAEGDTSVRSKRGGDSSAVTTASNADSALAKAQELQPVLPSYKHAALAGHATVRAVKFDLQLNTAHEITPYAEVYGQHPKEFDFARGQTALHDERLLDPYEIVQVPRKSKRKAARQYDDSDSDEDEEDGLRGFGLVKARGKLLGPVKLRQMPWSFWFVTAALLVWVRVMGGEFSKELAGM